MVKRRRTQKYKIIVDRKTVIIDDRDYSIVRTEQWVTINNDIYSLESKKMLKVIVMENSLGRKLVLEEFIFFASNNKLDFRRDNLRLGFKEEKWFNNNPYPSPTPAVFNNDTARLSISNIDNGNPSLEERDYYYDSDQGKRARAARLKHW